MKSTPGKAVLAVAAVSSLLIAFGDNNYFVVPPGTLGVPADPDYLSWETAGTNIHEAVYLSNAVPAQDGTRKNEQNRLYVKTGTYVVTNELVLGDCRYEIRSSKGPGAQDELDREGTVLRGGYPATTNRIFKMSAGSASRCSQIRGLTIANGWVGADTKDGRGAGHYGGGVCISSAAHAHSGVYDCNVVSNTAFCGCGGGVAVMTVGGVVSNCLVACNTATNVWAKGYNGYEFGGGGISLNLLGVSSTASSTRTSGGRIFDCIVSNNLVTGNSAEGSGIRAARAGYWFENCLLVDNRAEPLPGGDMKYPGAIRCDRLACVVGCIVTNNNGEGINCGPCSLVSNCVVACSGGVSVGDDELDNVTRPSIVVGCYLNGGGSGSSIAYATAKNSILRNCHVTGYGNTREGAVVAAHTQTRIENCTIVRNYRGLRTRNNIYPAVVNCVFDNRYSKYAQDISMPADATQGGAALSNCWFYAQDRIQGFTPNADCVFTNNAGFVDMAGADYHLAKKSILRDAGLKMDWMVGATDIEGNPRTIGYWGKSSAEALPDIGCYECTIGFKGMMLMVR